MRTFRDDDEMDEYVRDMVIRAHALRDFVKTTAWCTVCVLLFFGALWLLGVLR